ncbi:hypothetical protein XBFFL1_2380004 [Xenorhabdus bovienii str. feltiae Florida]|nr:hypothetical protein XBFFR1_310131 [Xenorhabdus bovienii str. feltiae France]CDG92951.1 hypothetical protein XBFFL1_2380004 [Xenorhabdus bovienii str. feltiae Florida]
MHKIFGHVFTLIIREKQRDEYVTEIRFMAISPVRAIKKDMPIKEQTNHRKQTRQ